MAIKNEMKTDFIELKTHALDVTTYDSDENDMDEIKFDSEESENEDIESINENDEEKGIDQQISIKEEKQLNSVSKQEIKKRATEQNQLYFRINGKWINRNWTKSIAVTYDYYKKKFERNCRLPKSKLSKNLLRTYYTIKPTPLFWKRTQKDFPWFFSWILTLLTFFMFKLFRKIIMDKQRKSWLAENIKSHKIKLLENESPEDEKRRQEDEEGDIYIKARISPRLNKDLYIKEKIMDCLNKVGIQNIPRLVTPRKLKAESAAKFFKNFHTYNSNSNSNSCSSNTSSPTFKMDKIGHHLERIPSGGSLSGSQTMSSPSQSAGNSSIGMIGIESPRSINSSSGGNIQEEHFERMMNSTFNPLEQLKIEEEGEITSIVDFLTQNSVICPDTNEISRYSRKGRNSNKRYQCIKSRRMSNNEEDISGSSLDKVLQKTRRNSNNSTSSLDIITGMATAGGSGRSWTGARSGEFYICGNEIHGAASGGIGISSGGRSPATSLQHSIEKYIQALDIQRAQTTPENILRLVTEAVRDDEEQFKLSDFSNCQISDGNCKAVNGPETTTTTTTSNTITPTTMMTPRKDFIIDRVNSNDDQAYNQFTGYKSGISLELTKMKKNAGHEDRKSITSSCSSCSNEDGEQSKLDMILVSKNEGKEKVSDRGDVEMISMIETPRIPDDVSRPVMAKVPSIENENYASNIIKHGKYDNFNNKYKNNDDVDTMMMMMNGPITFEINITEYKTDNPTNLDTNTNKATETTDCNIIKDTMNNNKLIKDKNEIDILKIKKEESSQIKDSNIDMNKADSAEVKKTEENKKVTTKKAPRSAPRAAPPPPPPPMKSRKKPGSKNASNNEGDSPILRNATVIELFKEVRNNSMGRNSNGKLAKTSSNASTLSGQPSADSGSFVKELEKNSKHFAKIQQEIATMSEMINKTISEINNCKCKTMGELDIFVAKIDRMLDSLTDESAVLKHFDWPGRYYIYREALSMWQEFRNMKVSLTNWKKGKGNVQTELNRMQKAMEKTISRFDAIMQTYESDKEKFKKNAIPWDNTVVIEVRHASVLLMDVYMSTLLTEYKNTKPALKKKNKAKNIHLFQDTVKLAFKMHQFAGGLSKSSPVLVEEIAATLRKLISNTDDNEDEVVAVK